LSHLRAPTTVPDVSVSNDCYDSPKLARRRGSPNLPIFARTKAADTEWGRRYDFRSILASSDPVRAYQSTVPLHTYEDLAQDVERIRSGEEDIIWPGRFTDFAVSSGTVSAGKIIPVSRETLIHNRRYSMGMLWSYLGETGNADVLLGRFLSLPGRIEEDPKHPGTFIGEVSGLQSRYAPKLVSRFLQAVPNDMLFLPNWEDKLNAVVRQTLDMDVRSVAMVPSWGLVFLQKLVQAHRTKYGSDARTVADVWPNLKVYFSGGVALESYRTLLEEQCGPGKVHFLEGYGASEGFFAFQLRPTDTDLALHVDNGVFFEFVPLEEVESPAPTRLWADSVETNVRYALYVTTCSGLWSYKVRDVVRFTETDPLKIVVAGRTSEMIDRFGEAVFGEETRKAMLEACRVTGARTLDYHVAPNIPTRDQIPRHQWFVEFEETPENAEAFANAIDAHLQDINRHYQIRREALAFGSPEVVAVPKGLFNEWLRQTRAGVSAQSKVPRMSESREVADALLTLVARSKPFQGAG
jgi:hypothetical protein